MNWRLVLLAGSLSAVVVIVLLAPTIRARLDGRPLSTVEREATGWAGVAIVFGLVVFGLLVGSSR